MFSRKHGCADSSAEPVRPRSGWWFWLGAGLLLAGCHHAQVSKTSETVPPRAAVVSVAPSPPLPQQTVTVKKISFSDSGAETSGEASKVPGTNAGFAAEAESRRPRGGKAAYAATNDLRHVSAIAAVGEETAPNVLPGEPELLPPPEKLPGPESASPIEPTANSMNLTLASALTQGLAENPDLVTLRGQVQVNQAMVDVADTPIWNPFVQAQLLPRGKPFDSGTGPGSGFGKTNYYVWAMQRFELAHQRRYRTQSAIAALNQVQWNIFQAELLNVAQSARLYCTALYQKELYELAAATADLNEHLLEVQRRRFQANLALARDVTTAEIAARQARRQADVARVAYESALVPLRQQLNIPISMPLALTDRLSDIRWLSLPTGPDPADEASYAAELVEGRPDVMAAQVGIQVAQANWCLARAAMIPDVQAGPIYDTSDAGTAFLGLRLQMDLPVWNTGRPLAHQRHMEVHQQALTYEQLKVKARLEAQTAINQYEQVRELAATFPPTQAGTIAPELQEIMRMFEAGQADFLAVLATQSDLLQERRTYLDLLNQLALSAANVIQATGLPLERLAEFPGPFPVPAAENSLPNDNPTDG